MATPEQAAAQAAHAALLEERDLYAIHKTFRNPAWKANNRRNKTIKTVLGEAARREASLLATPNDTSGAATPAGAPGAPGAPDTKASLDMAKLVLDKTLAKTLAPTAGAPAPTYTNIEGAMSMAPKKRYCDITGLPAPYTDPKTRLRYHNSEVFNAIRNFQTGVAEQYLELRNAHTVLK